MKQTLRIIALRTVRYNDKHSILAAYSREAGRISFLIADGNGREATRRRSLLQPLGVLECVADIVVGREICRMSEPRPLVPLPGLRSNPLKAAVAIFLTDLLAAALRESQPDAAMFDFIAASVARLDITPTERLANFHICFIMGLGRCLGIEPDTSGYAPGAVFDMADATFRRSAPMHSDFLVGENAAAVASLARMTYDNMHLYRFTRAQRLELLEGMLRFLSLHHAPMGAVKSLDILRTLF